MAIAFDNSQSYAVDVTSGSYTCTGTDRILFVGCFGDSGASPLVSAIKYAGVDLTLIDQIQVSGDRWVQLWYLAGPASGANTLAATTTADAFKMQAASYTGASQSGIPDDSSTAHEEDPGDGDIDLSVTTVADNCWTFAVAKNNSGVFGGFTGCTSRRNSDGLAIVDSNSAKTPPGAVNFALELGSAANYAGVIASFSPQTGSKVPVFQHSYRRRRM